MKSNKSGVTVTYSYDKWYDNAPSWHNDFVKVIRCRDCKRNKSDKWVDCPIAEMFGRTTDNYCSLAERRKQ